MQPMTSALAPEFAATAAEASIAMAHLGPRCRPFEELTELDPTGNVFSELLAVNG